MNNLDLNVFIEKVAEQYEEAGGSRFDETTRFKESEGWSSLMALLIISMAYEEYNVTLSREDIQQAETIHELYQRIQSKVPR